MEFFYAFGGQEIASIDEEKRKERKEKWKESRTRVLGFLFVVKYVLDRGANNRNEFPSTKQTNTLSTISKFCPLRFDFFFNKIFAISIRINHSLIISTL